jgi:hypothetical protein
MVRPLVFMDAGVHVTADVLFGALRVCVREIRFHSGLERDTHHRRVRTVRCASKEIRTQNVGRNYESRSANRGALYETPAARFLEILYLPCGDLLLIAIRVDGY